MDDPDATWQRVRELEAARAEVVRRARAGELTVGEAWEEVHALLLAAPEEVAAMRARLQRVRYLAAWDRGDGG